MGPHAGLLVSSTATPKNNSSSGEASNKAARAPPAALCMRKTQKSHSPQNGLRAADEESLRMTSPHPLNSAMTVDLS